MSLRPGRRAAAVAVALAALVAQLSAQASSDQTVRSTKLANGLEVIVVRNPSIPFVTLEMVFRAGAFTQTSDQEEGIPHLIEHMLFRRGDSGGESFEEAASKIEASWNGATDTESVNYFLTFPSKNLAAGMDLLSNLIRKPNFNKAGLEAERPVVRGELERRASEPMGLLRMDADWLLWEGEGWREKNPGGNIIALNAATPDQLSNLYKRFYVPNNAALVVSGDVVDTTVFNLANKIYSGWKRGPDPLEGLPPSRIAALPGIKRKITTAEVRDVTILVRWHGPSVVKDPAATYAADVFSGLVNQPLSGTQRRLVDAGLAESVTMSYGTLRNIGPIELMARTTADRAVAATEALGEELKKLAAADYFNDEDMALAKKLEHVGAQFRLESAAASAHALAELWGSTGLDYYMTYDKSLENQTRADVERYVASYLRGKPMVVSVLISPESWSPIARDMQRALGRWTTP